MPTRRQFIQSAALAAAAGMSAALPEAIARAAAIAPIPASTFLDAEHVVVLMQENRSFDHCLGALQGVRGFNDPRALTLPSGDPVWVQAGPDGKKFAPFRLDMHRSKATWMGSLPHTWSDQQDARNGGHHDRWIAAKRSAHAAWSHLPLTLGHHTREDLPFLYALADAFTVCDQHFCSSLTGTTPNRLFLWSGTLREKPTPDARANLRNENVDYGAWASWKTFPERLQEAGITWKVYQNEISVETGMSEEESAWLGNFTDNPLEFFTQFGVRFYEAHRTHREAQLKALPVEIEALRRQINVSSDAAFRARSLVLLNKLSARLLRYREEARQFTAEAFERLPDLEKALHQRAFSNNSADGNYRSLADFTYDMAGQPQRMKAPKGDILHQFRADAESGQLPTVSWLVPPERLSDHPSSPWYGAWCIAQVLDILTQKPELWQKTIFILTYDENDGFFDHAPPFVAPDPARPESGKVTDGIDAAVEFVRLEDDLKDNPRTDARGGPVGLGYRVPLIVASPWTRGPCINSQVFDHTSTLQLLEILLSHRTGKKIHEPNISAFRRAVCGDLTSLFGPSGAAPDPAPHVDRDAFLAGVHRAQHQQLPAGGAPLTMDQVAQARAQFRAIAAADFPDGPKGAPAGQAPIAKGGAGSGAIEGGAAPILPAQEAGVRRACPLPYDLGVRGALSADRRSFELSFAARDGFFGRASAGAPFIAHALRGPGRTLIRNYALEPGKTLADSFPLSLFDKGAYHLLVYGPNGFFAEFAGGPADPRVDISLSFPVAAGARPSRTGDVQIDVTAFSAITLHIRDNCYRQPAAKVPLQPAASAVAKGSHVLAASKSFGWHDFSITLGDAPMFLQRFAGRVETGRWTFTDPFMGRAER